MKVNESPLDRFVRLILGSALVIYGLFGLGGLEGATAAVIVAVVGGVLLFTAATGFCALYKLLGITTCKNCGSKTANR